VLVEDNAGEVSPSRVPPVRRRDASAGDRGGNQERSQRRSSFPVPPRPPWLRSFAESFDGDQDKVEKIPNAPAWRGIASTSNHNAVLIIMAMLLIDVGFMHLGVLPFLVFQIK
jgi:hypothetical protein